MPAPDHLRIHVTPSGDVEFSVPLTTSTDPSFIANMVSAIRAGIVTPPAPNPRPLDPHLPSPAPEPTSDRDRDHSRDRPPSPIITRPIRNLSVREIAAQLDAGAARHSLHLYSTAPAPQPSSDHHYDPVREFSSSPAVWLPSVNDSAMEALQPSLSTSREHIAASKQYCSLSDKLSRATTSQLPQTASGDIPPEPKSKSTLPTKSHGSANAQPHRQMSERALDSVVTTNSRSSFVSAPIRMVSLPPGAQHDDVDNMRFGLNTTAAHHSMTFPVSTVSQPHRTEELTCTDATTQLLSKSHVGDDIAINPLISPADRIRARRDRKSQISLDMQEGSRRTMEFRQGSELVDADHDRGVTPASPYVGQGEEDGDAWDNVDYEFTDPYRDGGVDTPAHTSEGLRARSNHRGVAWRLLSSLGSSFGRRRMEGVDDVYESTLGPNHAIYKTERILGDVRGSLSGRRRGHRFGRRNEAWFEFSAVVELERMVGELGRVANTLGFQVERRPGENKLRCVRYMNQGREMHVVVIVSSVRLPQGSVSVVLLKRAREDRNRTEAWKYAQFYRDTVERLERDGMEITRRG
eukprot:GFKZ01007766.1.p1 GENE.GFKZ01007766.1~~GFKZ01007766.1.p1  ORF type:complete len:577 (-),score=58.88 GFKZ01007766.1:684-2414(-)